MTKTKNKISFTEGKLFSKILLFVLPIVATNLLQTLYNAADMMVVSLSDEVNAVGAVGTTGSFVSLIVNIFIGFSVGANVVVARYIGAGEKEKARRAAHTALLVGLFFGVVGAAIGASVSRLVLKAMGNTGNLLDLAVKYTYFYFAGVPFLALTNYLIAIFRAKGDSKTPLIVLALAGLLNVGLNLFFVLALGMSVEGVALATSISNLVSFLALLWKLARDKEGLAFSFKLLKLHKKELKDIVYIGFPSALQSTLFCISNMLIQSSIVTVNNAVSPPESKYQPVVNGCAAGTNISNFVYTAQNAVYQGALTFTSQNIGANKPKRVYPIIGCCCAIVSVIGICLSSLIFLFKDPLLALYGVVDGAEGSLEAIAMEAATTQLIYNNLPYFLCGIMEVGSGVLRGLGNSVSSMVISLVGSCLLRVVWLLTVFPAYPTIATIYLCYPITWALTATVLHSCAILVIRRKIKLGRNE
ncbi:MAG: MATE family efflux transporter [Clostridia bacterium]|nr:MATE family efflux transporter [Clostridia bacterium]